MLQKAQIAVSAMLKAFLVVVAVLRMPRLHVFVAGLRADADADF